MISSSPKGGRWHKIAVLAALWTFPVLTSHYISHGHPALGVAAATVIKPGAAAETHSDFDYDFLNDDDDEPTHFTLPSFFDSDTDPSIAPFNALADPPAHNHTLRSRCAFRRGGYLYDLCPLLYPEWFNKSSSSVLAFDENGDEKKEEPAKPKLKPMVKIVDFAEDTPPTKTHSHFYLSLRGKLDMSGKQWDGRKCPEGTWICGVVLNFFASSPRDTYRVTKIIPIAGYLPLEQGHSRQAHPGLNGTVKTGPKQENASHPQLLMTLHGGTYVGKNQSAMFMFKCDREAVEPTKPEYSWSWNGFYVFSWRTKHACATAVNAPSPNPSPEPKPNPAPNTPDPTPETPPDDVPADAGGGGDDGYGSGDGSNEGDDFVMPDESGIPSRRWWRAGGMGFLWVLLITVASLYVLYANSARLREFLHTHVPLPAFMLTFLHSLPSLSFPSSLPSVRSVSSKIPSVNIPSISNPFSKRGRYSPRKASGSFRPGERRLRSWAQEEGALLFDEHGGGYESVPAEGAGDVFDLGFDADREPLAGEEDFMVNAGSAPSNAGSGKTKTRSYGSIGKL